VDVSGDEVLNYLDALLIHEHLGLTAAQASGQLAIVTSAATIPSSAATVQDKSLADSSVLSDLDQMRLAVTALNSEQEKPQSADLISASTSLDWYVLANSTTDRYNSSL
jgi:hypothetical protein